MLAQFELIPLFQVGLVSDYINYRIPGITVTQQGSLLACCEARKSSSSDWATIDILLRRSPDGAKTWSAPVKINPDNLQVPRNQIALKQNTASSMDHTFNNPVLIADRQPGLVHLLFCAEYERCFYMRSRDDGISWSSPEEITTAFEELRPVYNWRVIATGPGHGIQLQRGACTGRLLVPIWISTGTGAGAHRPSAVSTLYSDDGGATWHTGEIVVDNNPVIINPSETAAVELEDGQVMLNIRSESTFYRRVVSTSADGATHWSLPLADEALYEPICSASIQRLSFQPAHQRNRILFSNPNSQATRDPKQAWGRRENLTVRLSYDEGKTWPVSKVIDAGPGGYSDLAVSPDGTIYCVYEGSGSKKDIFMNTKLTVAKFNLAWLTDGKDVEL